VSAPLAGCRIEVIAPSGSHLSLDEFDRARAWFTAQGVEIRSEVPRQGWQRFSAPDADRLAAIGRAASRDDLDAVMITRGGYGLSRLIEAVDWTAVACSVERGCRWIGYSDFTVFHLALLAKTGSVSWAGPTFCADFGSPDGPDPDTLEHFTTVLAEHRAPTVHWAADPGAPSSVDEQGLLWGGNLAMLCSVAGSPWCPSVKGGLLFVEDIGEHPYRIERMLHQLHLQGILGRQRALIVGDISHWSLAPHDRGYDLDTVIAYWRERLPIPIITGLPFGHLRRKTTLGVGLAYRLQVAGGAVELAPSVS
jgi:muramoyltetrapeptide carboxypeptidase